MVRYGYLITVLQYQSYLKSVVIIVISLLRPLHFLDYYPLAEVGLRVRPLVIDMDVYVSLALVPRMEDRYYFLDQDVHPQLFHILLSKINLPLLLDRLPLA